MLHAIHREGNRRGIVCLVISRAARVSAKRRSRDTGSRGMAGYEDGSIMVRNGWG